MKMLKKIKNIFKLELFCNSAKFEDSGIGPILSPYLNREKINLFCDEFNKLTFSFNNDLRISVKLYLYIDNSFFFLLKGPNFSNIYKIIYGIENLSKNVLNIINIFDLYDIIYLKNIFFINKVIKYNSWFLKKQLINTINSIKNLKVVINYES